MLVLGGFGLIILASVIPIIRGADLSAKGAGPFTPRAEVWVRFRSCYVHNLPAHRLACWHVASHLWHAFNFLNVCRAESCAFCACRTGVWQC